MTRTKGRPPKKPEYNAEKIMQDLMDTLAEAYTVQVIQSDGSIRKLAEEFAMSPLKVRKLLITSGVFSTDISEQVRKLYAEGKTIPMIQEITGLSRASVHSYLPYTKMVYKADELSTNAERIRVYRERKEGQKDFDTALSLWRAGSVSKETVKEKLWRLIGLYQGYPFYTENKQKFSYFIKNHKIFINHNDEDITKASVNMALDRALDKALVLHSTFTESVQLKNFDSDYIYALFFKFGVLQQTAASGHDASTPRH